MRNDMKRKMFFSAAALVMLIVQFTIAQTDFEPEVIWESKSPVTFNILKFSPDDRYFYTRNDQGIHKFNSENGEYMGMYVEGYFNEFAFVEEYNWLVCASMVGLEIRDINTGAILKVLSQDTGTLHFDISQDNKRIVFTQGSELVDGNYIPLNMYVYSLPDYQEISKLEGTGGILQTKFTETAEEVVLVSYYGDKNYPVQIYSIPEKRYTKNIAVLNEFFQFMQISPDWKQVITVSTSSVNFYDIETGELKHTLPTFQPYLFQYNKTGDYYIICYRDPNPNKIIFSKHFNEIARFGDEELRKIHFLNLNNNRILGTGVGNGMVVFKMLHFDFDSLATGVEIKANISVIYPNPTSGFVNIPLNCINSSKYEIFNTSGRLVNSIEITGATNNLLKIDFTIYSAGVYSVKVYCGKDVFNYQVVRVE